MRWIVRLVAALAVLALLAVAVLVFLPADRIAAIAAQRIESATGRAVTIDGPVRATLWPQIGVATGPVTLAGPDWSDEGPMLTAEALEIRVEAATLFAGEPRISAMDAVGPRILVERAADGLLNWDLAPRDAATVADGSPATGAEAPSTAPTPPPATSRQPAGLDLLRISDGSLSVIDRGAGTRIDLSQIDLELTAPDLAGPAELTAAARFAGLPVNLVAHTEALASLGAGAVAPLTLAVRLGETALDFDGRAGLDPAQADGRLEVAGRDLGPVLAVLGAGGAALPAGLGRERLDFAGQVTLTPDGALHLRDGRLTLDENRLTLAADLQPGGPRPRLTAEITAGALKLGPAAGPGGRDRAGTGAGSDGGSAAAGGWSRERIDASGLGLVDADVLLAAEAIDLGQTRLGPTRARLALDNARAVLDIRETTLHGGRIAGQLIANARSGFSARADLSFADLALQPLLQDFAGTDRLISAATGSFNLLGVGDSVAALMSSLSGEGRIALGRGELRGLDIAGMLRTLDPGYVGAGQRTIFDSITGSFTVRDGVLRNDDLAMVAPLVQATGAGTVDIGRQRMDYRVTPVALQREDGSGGLRVPLAITGPWYNLRYRLDVEGLARDQLEDRVREERRQVEERAREALEREAERALGGAGNGRGALEDAVRDRLGREVERGLGRFLGRN